jgi:hypothetical protein
MNLHKHARTLVMAGLLAAAAVSAIPMQVQASRPWHNTKTTCQADGYLWDDKLGCADEYCNDALFGYGDPGESLVWQGRAYYCDGFTGQWTQLRKIQTGPTLPVVHPVGNAPATQSTPTGPVGPQRNGGVLKQ